MFYIKVSIRDKRRKLKESIPLSSLLSLSKHKFFEDLYVSDVAKGFERERINDHSCIPLSIECHAAFFVKTCEGTTKPLPIRNIL